MELFIGNLPPKVGLGDLITFFNLGSKHPIHMKQKDVEGRGKVVFAVAEFEDDQYAERFAEKYSEREFRGQPLVVREYFHRRYTNERRAVNWREKPWRAGERRRRDDRRVQEKDRDIVKEARLPTKEVIAAFEEKMIQEKKAAQLQVEKYASFGRKF